MLFLSIDISIDQAISSRERWHRLGVSHGALNILCDIAEAEKSPPSACLYILEDKASAGVCFVAPNHTRWQDGAKLLNVANRHILNIDERLGQAWFQGVEHAAW